MREGGSLTILATALVETGSKMDNVVFEEFKGTGNMELVLDRKLSEKRVFPAIDLARSSTRREDLLLTRDELMAADIIRKALNGMKKDEAAQTIIQMFTHTENNQEFVREVIRRRVL
jgi:transcription termination factor Rho